MKRILLPLFLVLLVLAACSQTKNTASVADNPASRVAEEIASQFIQAYETYDAEGLISTFHDEYVFMDYGMDDGPYTKGNISYFIKESMAEPDTWKAQFDEYTITPDGRFAVLAGTFSMVDKRDGEMVTVPAYVVLEVKDGLIIAETWYYNGEVFQ